jgi:hypothetical protein
MKIKLIIFLFLIAGFSTTAQPMEITFSLGVSCIDTSKQSIQVEITISNHSENDCWIDLSAINCTFYEGDNFIEPTAMTIIGLFTPGSSIENDCFILVKKSSTITVNIASGIFHNYHFVKGVDYTLHAEYANPRRKYLKRIPDSVIIKEYPHFSICS